VTKHATLLQQRLPFAGLLGAAIAGISVAACLPLNASVFLAACAGALLFWAVSRRTAGILLAVAAAFATAQTWQTRESAAHALAARLGDRRVLATATGVVSEEPAPFGASRVRFTLAVRTLDCGGESFSVPTEILVVARGPAPGRGDLVRATGSLLAIPPARNPAQFDAQTWMGLRDITCEMDVAAPADLRVTSKAAGFSLPRIARHCRTWMQATLRIGIADDPVVCDLIAGMVLRVTSSIPDALQQEFRNTGTFHLFAVSGLHVGMVGVILWQALKIVGVGRRPSVALIIPALFFYVLITGWKSASLRAAVMSAIFLIGMGASLRPVSINSLCAAGFFILVQGTNELFNPGFQFSFFVVGSILLLVGPIHAGIRRFCHPDPFLPRRLWSRWQRWREWLAEKLGGLFSVSLAAWIGSFPLTFAYFHIVSFSALPANFLIIPLAFAIMATAALALMGGLLWTPLAAIFNNANWAFTKVLLAVVQTSSAFPGSYLYAGVPSFAPATVTVFDFGEGGAAGIEAGGRLWLVDCGSAWQLGAVIEPWIHSRGKSAPDGLVLTHGDVRHIGGALDLILRERPGMLVESPLKDRSPYRAKLHRELEALGVAKSIHWAGDRIEIADNTSLKVLHPPPGLFRNEADDKGIVLRLDTGKARVLFLSDAGSPTEQWLLENMRGELRADILLVGRHRSNLPMDGAFLAAVRPSLVVRAASAIPQAELDAHFAATLAARGIRLFSQDRTGAVKIEFFPGRFRATGYFDRSEFSAKDSQAGLFH